MIYFTDYEKELMKANLERRLKLGYSLKFIGHRGMCNNLLVLENTLNAFKQAIIFGADGIEFDVFSTLDGTPIISHDEVILTTRPRDRMSMDIDEYSNMPQTISPEVISPSQSLDSSLNYSSSFLPNLDEVSQDHEVNIKKIEIINLLGEELRGLQIEDDPGDRVPTLLEVLALVEEANLIRNSFKFLSLSLHIEFKQIKEEIPSSKSYKIFESVFKTVQTIIKYQKDNYDTSIKFEDIYFCSFSQSALSYLIELFYELKINFKFSLSVSSQSVFGKENVGECYEVLPTAQYNLENIQKLKNAFFNEEAFVAYDFILWDVSKPLIEVVLSRKKFLIVSATNWKNYNNNQELVVFLLILSRTVNTVFKCDDCDQMQESVKLQLDLEEKQRLLNKRKSDVVLMNQKKLFIQYQEERISIEKEELSLRNELLLEAERARLPFKDILENRPTKFKKF